MVTAQQQLEFEVRLRDFMTKELKRLGAQVDKTTTKAESAFKRLQRQLGLTSTAAKRLGLGLKAIGAAAVFMGMRAGLRRLREFSRAMAEVSTIMDTSKLSLKDAEEGVRALSREYAQASPDVAKGLYQTLSAGITDANEAMILLGGATQLGVAGLATTRQSVDLLTSVFNAYGKTVTEEGVEKTNDMIFKTIELGKTTMPELASSFGRILPMAATLGIEFHEIAAAVSALTLSGLDTAEAVTQVGAVFTAFLRKAELSKDMLGEYSDVMGSGAMRTKGFRQSIEDLVEATGHNDDVLVKLMGRVEGVKAVMALTGNQAETFADQIDLIGTASGNSQRAAVLMMNTVDAKMRAMSEGWTTMWEGFMLGLTGVSDQMNASEITEQMQAMSDKASVVGTVISTAFFSVYGAIEKVGNVAGNVFRGQGTRLVEEMGVKELQEAFDTLEYSSEAEKFRDHYLGMNLDIESVIGSVENEISLRRTQLTLLRNVGATDTAAFVQSEIDAFKEKITLLKEEEKLRASGGRGFQLAPIAAQPLTGMDVSVAESAAHAFREKFEATLKAAAGKEDLYLVEINALISEYEGIMAEFGAAAQQTDSLRNNATLVGERTMIEEKLAYHRQAGEALAAQQEAWAQEEADRAAALAVAVRQQGPAQSLIDSMTDANAVLVSLGADRLKGLKQDLKNYEMSTRESATKEVTIARKKHDISIAEFEQMHLAKIAKAKEAHAKQLDSYEEALQEEGTFTEQAIEMKLAEVKKGYDDEIAAMESMNVEQLEALKAALAKQLQMALKAVDKRLDESRKREKAAAAGFVSIGAAAAAGWLKGWKEAMKGTSGMTAGDTAEALGLTDLHALEGLVSPTAVEELATLRETLKGARAELALMIKHEAEIGKIVDWTNMIKNVKEVALVEAEAAAELERFGVAARDVAGLMDADLAAAAGTMSESLVFLSTMVVPDAITQFQNFEDQIANARIEAQTLFDQGLISEAQLTSLQQMIDKLERIEGLELKLASDAQALEQQWTDTGLSWSNVGDSMSAGLENWAATVDTMNVSLQNIVEQGMNQLVGAMMSYVDGTKDAKEAFEDFAKSFLLMIVQMIIKQMILNALKAFAPGLFGDGGTIEGGTGPAVELAMGGVVGGGLGRAIPLKGYATGGPVMNSPHIALMGEGRYNEAVVPLPDGKSIPVQMAGGNQSPTVNIKIEAVDAQSVDELLISRQDTIRNLIRQAMTEDRAFHSTFTTTKR